MRAGSNRGKKCGDVPAITTQMCQGKPIMPVSINTAITLNTLVRGGGEYSDKELEVLPHYAAIIFEKLLKIKKRTVGLPAVNPLPSLATKVIKDLRADTVNLQY